jgi:hypothetical protein
METTVEQINRINQPIVIAAEQLCGARAKAALENG